MTEDRQDGKCSHAGMDTAGAAVCGVGVLGSGESAREGNMSKAKLEALSSARRGRALPVPIALLPYSQAGRGKKRLSAGVSMETRTRLRLTGHFKNTPLCALGASWEHKPHGSRTAVLLGTVCLCVQLVTPALCQISPWVCHCTSEKRCMPRDPSNPPAHSEQYRISRVRRTAAWTL